MTTNRRRRRRGLRLAAAGLLCAAALAGCAQRAPGVSAIPGLQWPASICKTTVGGRIAATTTANGDTFRVEPTARTPQTTAATAYAAYRLRVPAGPSRAQAPTLQVRYGLVTDGSEGYAGGPVGAVPHLRRYPAWVISVCDSPVGMGSRSARVPAHGTLIAVVDDTRAGRVVAGDYAAGNHAAGGSSIGLATSFVVSPPAAATSYYGAAWTIADRHDHGSRVLLRYTPRRCTTLDHVVTDARTDTHRILTVVLSGPVRGQPCPTPSGASPYVAVTLTDRLPLTTGRTGRLRYQPSASGGPVTGDWPPTGFPGEASPGRPG